MKKVNWVVTTLLAACVVLTGCESMLKSERETNWARTKEQGQYYYLPKAVVKVTGVWDNTTGLWDLTATPVYGADTNAGVFMVKRHEVVVFDDNWSVGVDPNTGLLLSVTGSSTDQTVNSIASLESAALAFAGLPTGVGTIAGSLKGFAALAHKNLMVENNAKMTPEEKDFCDTVSNAQFSSFQTYLDPSPAWDKSKSDQLSLVVSSDKTGLLKQSILKNEFLTSFFTNNLDQYVGYTYNKDVIDTVQKPIYVMSPMVNGQVTYARYDLTLKRLSFANLNSKKETSFPKPMDEDEGNEFNGVLVRDAIPYSLEISGKIWFTHWVASSATPAPGFLSSSNATQPGQQVLPLQYGWTYNLPGVKKNFDNDFPASGDFSAKKYTALQQTLNLPDVNHTRVVKVSRRPLVQDSTTLTLANGIILSRQQVRPSIVMGILGIPKTLITAIAPLPGGGGGSGGGGGGGGSSSGGSSGGGGGGGSSSGSGSSGGPQNSSQGQTSSGQFAPIQ
jgi:uncharacterized membrane protein YgcG